jgi:hypothetical protein
MFVFVSLLFYQGGHLSKAGSNPRTSQEFHQGNGLAAPLRAALCEDLLDSRMTPALNASSCFPALAFDIPISVIFFSSFP